MYTFVLMMKKKEIDAQLQLITAVTEDEIAIMFDVLENTIYEPFAEDYDFVCYTFYHGNLVEVSLYDKEEQDFKVLIYYEEDDKE